MVRSALGFFTKIMLVLTGAAALAGCASDLMVAVQQEPAVVATPQSDKATVIFYRTSIFGGAVQAAVFDISTDPPSLVGIVSSGTKIAYVCDPGSRRFMVVSEAADFMGAELAAGKTYYALVTARIGAWRARFSLRPVPASNPDLAADLNGMSWVENTPRSEKWAADNMRSVQEKRQEYWPKWEQKPDKPILNIDDGR